MASFTAGTTFVDGVANDVTAAKLAALVNNATPTSGLIQDRTAETVTATNDTILFGDASDSNTLKRITVANFAQTLPTAKVTTGTIDTGTFGTTTSTAVTITTGTITNLNSTTGTVATLNSTTATIPTITSITKITSGTGTAAAPAISPTGDTNTGIFFPAADTVAFSEGGAEAMRIDSNGRVLVNSLGAQRTTNLSDCKLQVYDSSIGAASNANYTPQVKLLSAGTTAGAAGYFLATRSRGSYENPESIQANDFVGNLSFSGYDGTTFYANAGISAYADGAVSTGTVPLALYFQAGVTSGLGRMVISSSGNVSIGTNTALSKLHVHGDLTLSNATTAVTASTSTITPPATVAGYLTVSINGTSRKIPYYAT